MRCILRLLISTAWAPAGMGRGQVHVPTGNIVKCFLCCKCCLKSHLDDAVMHYFEKMSSASGGFVPRPHPRWRPPPFRPPRCLSLEKLLRAPMLTHMKSQWCRANTFGVHHHYLTSHCQSHTQSALTLFN